MAQRISDLIGELKATEEQKKLSEFTAMQLQIRPHFLFNTLHTIGLEAEYGNNGKVRRLIGSLTEQLQYILHSTPQPVAFREELQAAERYIELMMARYEGAFALEMDIDPATLGSLVPLPGAEVHFAAADRKFDLPRARPRGAAGHLIYQQLADGLGV